MNTEPGDLKPTLTLVRMAATTIAEKKGVDISAYDVRTVSSITDFFLVCSGLNTPHLKALSDDTRLVMKAQGVNCWRISGNQESGWIVADYVDFIIHFFKKDARDYYQIDQLWQNMPNLDLRLVP